MPVAEAMACGCSTVGYSGLGGRELFLAAAELQLAVSVEYGDWLGFIVGVALIIDFFNRDTDIYYSNIKSLASYVATHYSSDQFEESLLKPIDCLRTNNIVV